MEVLEIIETEKRKPSALFNGYQYTIHRKNKENVINWACINERTQKCSGRMATKDGIVLRVSNHVCKPDIARTEVKKSVSQAKKRAREEEQSISEIYREELTPLFNRGYDFVTEIPLFESTKSSLYRARKRQANYAKEPENAEEIVFPDKVLRTNEGENFLLFDEREEKRMLAFATRKGKEVMEKSKVFFMDGTFKSCSKQFAELYTIHADIGSTPEETYAIPVVFALLPDKKQRTYEQFFALLKRHIADWNPEVIVMDFEVAVMVSLNRLFPSALISGCNFHFNQCLWRKIQEIGLVTDYKNNEEIRLHLRMCAALAYLPIENIDDGWLCIQEESPSHAKLQEFYDYFVRQWLENSAISREMWNCNGKLHRTNNIVEGWNNRLNTFTRKMQSGVLKLVNCLKGEASHSDFIYDRSCISLEGKKRKTKTVKLDERIRRATIEYVANGDIRKFLCTLAYVQKFE